MKKILLIPTALAVASTPLVSLVGCSNTDQPDDLEKYKVTKQEMEDAISFKGVSYLQGSSVNTKVDRGTSYKITQDFKCSPTIYYYKDIDENPQLRNPYLEEFVEYDAGTGKYKKTSRTDPLQTQWEVDSDADEDEFITVEEAGEGNFILYYEITGLGKKFTFDESKKCYSAKVSTLTLQLSGDYYFENKKLLKVERYYAEGTESEHSIATFTYDQITPQPSV